MSTTQYVTNNVSDSIKLPGIKRPLPANAITHLEGYGNYTRIYLLEKPNPIVISQTLKWFEDQLPQFVRVHKSLLVNNQFVRGIARRDQEKRTVWLRLQNNASVKVSRRRADTVLTKLSLRGN